MMSDSIQDPENYERMAKPYQSKVDGTAALNGFFNDVLLARQKWRIPEIVIACAVYIDSDSKTMAQYQRMGDFMVSPLLAEHLQTRITSELLAYIENLTNKILRKERENESGAQIPFIDPETP